MATKGRALRTIKAYRVKVKISGDKRVLVEGKDDRNILVRLFNKLANSGIINNSIDIDIAEDLESPPGQGMGNREKVEEVCRGLGLEVAGKFAGFVDREFRRFDLSADIIADEIGAHSLNGRLLWSRGHSIENYLFSFPIMSHAVQNNSHCRACYDALARLEPKYGDAIRLACAIGLAAAQHNRLEAMRDCIRWNELQLEPVVMLDKTAWIRHISSKHPKVDAESLYSDICMWYDKLAACSEDTIQWLCDGHIGLAVSLAAYQRAVFDATDSDPKEASKSLSVHRTTCAISGAVKWAEMATAGLTV